MAGLSLMAKKLWKKLRAAKRFAVNIFSNKIVREVLGFILIIAILYFGVSGVLVLALRTDTYWMAVISDSMKHDGASWREYFETRGDNSYQFPLQGGFERGDMLIIQGVSSVTEISIGDVILLDAIYQPIPLVHRVVEIWDENGKARFKTLGDGNRINGQPKFISGDYLIRPEQIRGKVVFVIPKIGWLSLWFQGS